MRQSVIIQEGHQIRLVFMGTHHGEHTDSRELTLTIEIDATDELTQALLGEINGWRKRDLSIDTTTREIPNDSGTTRRVTLSGPAAQFVNLVSRPEGIAADGGVRDSVSA